MPDSWLVLYNTNGADSIAWAQWYQEQRGIPSSHMLGLDASLDEHLLDFDAVQDQIIGPVRDLLDCNPELEASIMGIVLGYQLPGHYDRWPSGSFPGGFSIADALQDMYDDVEGAAQKGNNPDNPRTYGTSMLPEGGRLTKASMTAGRYMVARIDAPTLADAMALTERAKTLGNPAYSMWGESVWYDYYDPDFPPDYTDIWAWLWMAVEAPELGDLPWAEFDLDGIEYSAEAWNDAFRFSTYKLYGWDQSDFDTESLGSRVLAFHFNSFGAVTVRSTSAEGALFVPNALAVGYAAAVGATGEPASLRTPYPDTLLASLREGWTLGEAFYLANPYDDWMWTLIGDPFLRLPNWFDEVGGDINTDGLVNLQDLAGFRACLSGPGTASASVCHPFDFNHDGDADLADFAGFQRVFTGGPVTPVTGDFDDDSDVDLTDLESLVNCQTDMAPTVLESGCAVFDFNFDLDVDLKDYGRFQSVFTGSFVDGDYNRDGDVDIYDFAYFDGCVTGPENGPATEDCAAFYFDDDNDVDLADFAAFQKVFGS